MRSPCCHREGEGQPEVHSFKHDLVREACYSLLVLPMRQALHGAAATYFESAPSGQGGQGAVVLAHHWTLAGRHLRALEHLEVAGFRALSSGSDVDALATLEAARAVVSKMSTEQTQEVGRVRQAEVLRGVGEALHGVGRNDQSNRALRQAIDMVGVSLPKTTAGWVLRLIGEAARQMGYRLFPARFRWTAPPDKQASMRVAALASSWLTSVFYFQVEPLKWLTAGLLSANLAEASRAPEMAGAAYVNLSNIFGMLRLRRIERVYLRLAELSPERRVEIIGLSSMAVVSMAHLDWVAARGAIADGTAKAREARDWWALGNGLTIQALITSFTGPIALSLTIFDELAVMMRARDYVAQEAYALVLSVPTLLSMGEPDTAWQQLEQGVGKTDRFDHFGRLSWHAARSAVLQRTGKLHLAVPEALKSLQLFNEKPLMLFTHAGPFLSLAEVLLEAAEVGEDGPQATIDEIRAGAQQAVGRLGEGALLFGYFKARHQLARGIAAWIGGDEQAARKSWDRALTLAEEAEMPWDKARVHLEISRRAAPGSAERRTHAASARAILEPMGAVGDLALLPTA